MGIFYCFYTGDRILKCYFLNYSSMKPLLILTITALTLISSCASPENKSPANPAVACGADEVLVDGNCVPKTETTNSSLFDQDLDSFVVATIVNSGALKGYLAEPSTPGNYP